MGGKAFIGPPHNLITPRLPTPLYNRLCTQYQSSLSQLYRRVACPIPAPEKQSHGDIDILVALPLPVKDDKDGHVIKERQRISPEEIQKALGAEYTCKSGGSRSYAVRNSSEVDFLAMLGQQVLQMRQDGLTNAVMHEILSEGVKDAPRPRYIQVDVTVCPSEEMSHWHHFHHSHGDLWNLIGTCIRRAGLTANDRGFNVRIAEIEHYDRKKSLIWLTTSPTEVLHFLGYQDEDIKSVLTEEFASWDHMFRFVARCRFFRTDVYEAIMEGQGDGKSKANDRKRMAQRDGFRRFVQDWVPKYRQEECKDDSFLQKQRLATRGEVLEEALDTFGKREEHDTKLQQWRKLKQQRDMRSTSREERKVEYMEMETYVQAWIDWLNTIAKTDSAA